jgi:hypothetical protein
MLSHQPGVAGIDHCLGDRLEDMENVEGASRCLCHETGAVCDASTHRPDVDTS